MWNAVFGKTILAQPISDRACFFKIILKQSDSFKYQSASQNPEGLTIVFGRDSQNERRGDLYPLIRRLVFLRSLAPAAAEHIGINNSWVKRDRRHAFRQFFSQCTGKPLNHPFRYAIRSNTRCNSAPPPRSEIHNNTIAP